MKQAHYFLLIGAFSLLQISSCGQDDEPNTWLIPETEVFDGGPGKDGIPSIDQPSFSNLSDIQFLEDDDLVVLVKVGNEIKAYPHPILDWHEIVNDEIGDRSLAITYCPLTGTAIAWDRELDNGRVTTFGVSGLLYNTNLIPYDRQSDSNWSQMQLRSVSGERAGQRIATYPVVETTWGTLKRLHPGAFVLNTDTGFDRDYQRYPYGDYRTNDNLLLFPISNQDDRLPEKDRGLGILLGGQTKFYPLERFSNATTLIDQFEGTDLLVLGSQEENYLVAFEQRLSDGTEIQVGTGPLTNPAAIFIDSEGNQWNIFGEAVSGPRMGSQLTPVESYMSYWFAWAAFYPDVELAN